MSDHVQLTKEELEIVAKHLCTHPEAVSNVMGEINDQRDLRTAGAYTEVPRSAITDTWTFKTPDELKAKIEYLKTFNQREDRLRTDALRLALKACLETNAYNVTETAERFYKFLLKGEVSRIVK